MGDGSGDCLSILLRDMVGPTVVLLQPYIPISISISAVDMEGRG